MAEKPTVAPQAVTDRMACALVEGWLAKGWVVRPQFPDYHEDYLIEPVVGGELTGLKFFAQQKGNRALKAKNGVVMQQMKIKHLLYYAEKEQLPVFLFSVDVGASVGYFVFLQEWIDNHHDLGTLKKSPDSKLSVAVPVANVIADSGMLVAEVRRSLAYMKRKYPGSVQDAIAHDLRRMAELDPRWNVTLDVVGGVKVYTAHPKEDVSFSMQIEGAHSARLQEFLDFGKRIELPGSAVKLSGSPFIDQASIASIAIGPSKGTRTEVNFWTEGPGSFRLTLPAHATTGSKGVAIAGELEGAPLRAEFRVVRPTNGVIPDPGITTFSWPFERWGGLPVSRLPYFEPLHALSMAILAGTTINHEFLVQGDRITRGTFGTPSDDTPFERAALIVDYARKLREISAKVGQQLTFPNVDSLDSLALVTAEIAYEIVTEGQFQGRSSTYTVEATLAPKDSTEIPAELVLQALESVGAEGWDFVVPDYRVVLNGTEISLGTVMQTLKPVTITVGEASKANFISGKTSSLAITIAACAESTITMKRVPAS